jgi:hypothetical protein
MRGQTRRRATANPTSARLRACVTRLESSNNIPATGFDAGPVLVHGHPNAVGVDVDVDVDTFSAGSQLDVHTSLCMTNGLLDRRSKGGGGARCQRHVDQQPKGDRKGE